MNPTRITRLLKLLQTLQAGQQRHNADGLAKACGVSRRTMFRDLETLRAAGVPLQFDKTDSRYSLADDYFLQSTNLNSDEALAVVSLAARFGSDSRGPFFDAARSGAMKLLGSLPATMRQTVQPLARAISVRLPPFDPLTGKEAVYQSLVDSISQRQVALITYQSLTEFSEIKTQLRLYHLLLNRHSWYAIGRSSLHKDIRTFNVSRISSVKLLNRKYAWPRDFSLERYLGNAWNIMPQEGPDENVVVKFSPLVAQNVAEVAWHPTQRVEFQRDGSLLFHVQVSGLNEIIWWILGYGDQAETLRPAKLRKQIAQRAKNLHQTYVANGDQTPSGLGRIWSLG